MPQEPTTPSLVPRTFRRRKQLEQDLEHITQEMYRRNRELADTNQTLSLLRTIDSIVLQSQESLKVVSEQIVDAITSANDYPLVALLIRPTASQKELELYSVRTNGQNGSLELPGLKRTPHLNLADDAWLSAEAGSKHMVVDHFEPADIASFLGCSVATARSIKKQLPLKSVYVVKLIARQRLVGLMVVGFYSGVADIAERDMTLLDRLSEPVGIAVDNRLLFEENRRVLLQLQHSNTKLKALDETKDDFISMASHQLRTPLTSVKGYLSMVLEGDAGKLTETERKMLTQAYTSSQRMVYLVADLLNVSRLKTGKFIIDPAPTDLSRVIDEEIGQLTETAAARSVKLEYKRPKAFPSLMLDETKTRQVIMNFIDNAIYYTPSGGHIQVLLLDKPSTVELRVVDDGIGVPRAEQHLLFTKFYRAGNARKARPDGTGLGLFMAKKVITAQGGATIFESAEGKGSTFGFIFDKAKLAVPSSPTKA